jgi:AcrR family transcriptional regulator
MPVQAGTALDPEATKAKVLTAATALFYERGVHSVGVSEIASRANASKLSIYRYFGSKEGLVTAVLAQRSEHVHAWLIRQMTNIEPGRERVLALFDLLIHWFGEQSYRGCIVMNTAIDTRGSEGTARSTARKHLARYHSLLENELTQAQISEPETLARQLLILIEGATVISAVNRVADAGHDARKAAEALLDAYGPPPGE